jgi:hypothetical protein
VSSSVNACRKRAPYAATGLPDTGLPDTGLAAAGRPTAARSADGASAPAATLPPPLLLPLFALLLSSSSGRIGAWSLPSEAMVSDRVDC